MITEEAAEHILADLFAHRAQDHPDSRVVLQTVQERVAQRRTTRPGGPLVLMGVAAAVVAIALASTLIVRSNGPGAATAGAGPTSTATAHPGLDQLTGTCLDIAKVLASWGNPTVGWGGVASDSPNGAKCNHEADIVSATRPPVQSPVLGGKRTVYIAQSPPGIRTGFLELSAAESAAAAAASGGNLSAGRPYFILVSIPDDNPQTVLVAILQQFPLPG